MKYFTSIAAALVAATLLTASSCKFIDKLWKKTETVSEVPVVEETSPVAEIAAEEPVVADVEVDDAAMVHEHDEK